MGISIAKGREGKFLILFVVLSLLWLSSVIWFEVDYQTEDNALGTAVAIGTTMGPLVILNTAVTVTIVEGGSMLAEQFKQRRYEEGQREGRALTHKAWEEWNRRRLEAERKGEEEFTEPPPSLP